MTSDLTPAEARPGAVTPRRGGEVLPVRLTVFGFLVSLVVGVLLFIPGFGIPALLAFLRRYTLLRAVSLRATVVVGLVLEAAFWPGALASQTYAEVWIAGGVTVGLLFPLLYLVAGLVLRLSRPAPGARSGWERLAGLLHRRLARSRPEATLALGYRRLLEIEQAQTPQERRWLLAREFGRLAGDALRMEPTDRSTWPDLPLFQDMQRQTALLLASATDPEAGRPPDPTPPDRLTDETLVAAIRELAQYLDQVAALRAVPGPAPEQLRVWARERAQLQRTYDAVLEQMQAS